MNKFSINHIFKLVEKIIVFHASLNFFFSVFAITTLASSRFAKNTHLEAFTILLLAVALLASASINMPRCDVSWFCAFCLTCTLFRFKCFFVLFTILKESVWTKVLNLWFECLRISISYCFPCVSYHSRVFNDIGTPFAWTILIAESANREAFTVHFQTSWFAALTCQTCNCAWFLSKHSQLGIKSHCALSFYCFLPKASCSSFRFWIWRLCLTMIRFFQNRIICVLISQVYVLFFRLILGISFFHSLLSHRILFFGRWSKLTSMLWIMSKRAKTKD